MQRQIIEKDRLLNEAGEINERGYATELILEYNRKHIKANPFRIKEWDYYFIGNDHFGIAFTVADNSYMGLISVSFLNFDEPSYKTTSIIKPLTFGRLRLPSTSKVGDVIYKDKRIDIQILNDGMNRKINCKMRKFDGEKDLECQLVLFDEPEESMVIATPFVGDRKAFYYNQKINGMKADGVVLYGGSEYTFDASSALGTLDWGRGVWTYKNTWYWGSASGIVDGKSCGFNIGYGFGDTSSATENMVFYDGQAHKLEDVHFNIPMNGNEYDYMKPWVFTSSDGRFEMNFKPIMDRKDYTSIGIISSDQHQVFGKFSGKCILNDGKIIEIEDFLGFAERVSNRW